MGNACTRIACTRLAKVDANELIDAFELAADRAEEALGLLTRLWDLYERIPADQQQRIDRLVDAQAKPALPVKKLVLERTD